MKIACTPDSSQLYNHHYIGDSDAVIQSDHGRCIFRGYSHQRGDGAPQGKEGRYALPDRGAGRRLSAHSPYDPEFARQMALAEDIMHDDREVLRALAK